MATETATSTRPDASAAREGGAEAINVEHLTRRYGEREALADVSAHVARGETLAVLGRNGAGKTTFLRVLATLLLPHDGRVQVLGLGLPREAHAVRARIGLLGHETLLYRDLSARENLVFYARLYGVADRDARIAELLGTTGMGRRAEEPVRNLSRGMAQRVAVCRAVLHRPELLLLDEPHAHLDPAATKLVEPLIGRPSGTTRVLVSHDAERAVLEADRVLGLLDGRAVVNGPADEVTADAVRGLYGVGA